MSSCIEHKLVLLLDTSLSQGFGALFRMELSCWIHCDSFAEIGLNIFLLTRLPLVSTSPLYNNWELLIGSTAISSDRSLLCSIFKWYAQDNTLEMMEIFLEVILFKKVDLFLIVSLMSMSILDGNLAIFWDFRVDIDVRKCLFASSLTGPTIQDNSTRERSNVTFFLKKINNLLYRAWEQTVVTSS